MLLALFWQRDTDLSGHIHFSSSRSTVEHYDSQCQQPESLVRALCHANPSIESC